MTAERRIAPTGTAACRIRWSVMLFLTLLLAFGFAAIHLFIGRMRFLACTPRSRWLSGAGGVAVACIFLHIRPDLSTLQRTFGEAPGFSGQSAQAWAYWWRWPDWPPSMASNAGQGVAPAVPRQGEDDAVEAQVFWLRMGSFALYKVLISYLLLRR